MALIGVLRGRNSEGRLPQDPQQPFIDLRRIVEVALVAVVTYAATSAAQSPERMAVKLADHQNRIVSLETTTGSLVKTNERILDILERRYGK